MIEKKNMPPEPMDPLIVQAVETIRSIAVPPMPLRVQAAAVAKMQSAARQSRLALLYEGIKNMNKFIKYPAAAAGLAACLVICLLLAWPGSAQPAWGAVADQLKHAPAFSVTIYMKKDALSEPQQAELWSDQQGRVRCRAGTQVLFAENKRVMAFDVKSGKKTAPNRMLLQVLEKLEASGGISLEGIVKTLAEGITISEAAKPTPDVSKELLVYDAQTPARSEWLRIWVLKGNRLPTRVLVWRPRSGRSVDAVFSYDRVFGKNAFDAEAFAKELDARRAEGTNPYLLLDDADNLRLTDQGQAATTAPAGSTTAAVKKITANNATNLLAQIEKMMNNGSATMEDVLQILGQPDVAATVSGDSAKPYRVKYVLEYICADPPAIVRIKVTIGDGKVQEVGASNEIPSTQPLKEGDAVLDPR